MCGIAGFNWEDKGIIKKMNATLEHRGPDGEGTYTNKGISLGHRRLSIIDLSSAGKQPMCNEDGSIWITFNGEIYNFKLLRAELEQLGHSFKSNTDTEVIVHSYEEWGDSCVQKFNGMFAFAIWNDRTKELFLARDRLGIKPLYYYWDEEKFIFASEIKAILQSNIKREINKNSLDHFFAHGFTPANFSILKNIYKLQPGHSIKLIDKEIEIKKYWDIKFNPLIKSKKYYMRNIDENLNKSVSRRLLADVPVGAFLSGGVDSTTLVAYIKKYKENLKTFSIGFEYKEFDESKFAKSVAQTFNTDHYENILTTNNITKLIPRLASIYDDPLADYSTIPTYFVSKIARKHVKVCLGGDGGDELFGGYNWYTQFNILKKQNYFPPMIKKHIIKPLLNNLLDGHLKDRLNCLITNNKINNPKLYATLRSILNKQDLLKLNIDPKVYSIYQKYFKYKNYNDLFNSDIKLYLPEQILHKVDKASMAVGLETRVPFLDHEMAEFSSKIPYEYKIKNGIKKYILKETVKNMIPKQIINRKKQGFGIPLKQYFRQELKDFVNSNLEDFSYVDKIYLNKILEKHQSSQRDYSHLIFSFITFNEWSKKWL